MNYYIRSQGTVYGPYDTNTMLGFVKEGRVIVNTEVSLDQANWIYAGHVPELFAQAAPQAPTAPTAPVAPTAPASDPYGMQQQSSDPYGLTPMASDPYGMQPMGQNEYGLTPLSSDQPSTAYGVAADPYGTTPVAPGTSTPFGASGGGGTDWDGVLSEPISSGPNHYDVPATSSNPYSPPSGNSGGYAPPKRRRNTGNEGAATVSLILGIISILLSCCPLIGWITGGIGLNQANQAMDSSARGMAVAGKILCIIGLTFSTIVFVLNIVARAINMNQ